MKNTLSLPADNLTQATEETITSPLVELINKVKEKIAAIDGIRYVDEDWGQLDYYTQYPPVQWPCVLVDFSEVNYEDIGRGKQTAEGYLSIRLADLKLGNTSNKAPQTQKDNVHNIMEIAQTLHAELQTWKGFTRTRTTRAKRDDAIREYVITYRFALYEV